LYFDNINLNELEENRNSTTPGGDAAFGCSFTFGYGIEHENSWPCLLGLYNCGQSGSSNDRITRLAIEYINTYKPANIYVMWTINSRREWIDESNSALRFKVDDPRKELYAWEEAHIELSNFHNDVYNYKRNRMLLEAVCETKGVKLHETNLFTPDHTDYPLAIDNSHPGVEWHAVIADKFSTE